MTSPREDVAIVQLTIFLLLAFPQAYVLYRHGWTGFLGWVLLLALSIMQAAGGGMTVQSLSSKGTITEGAMIISSVGISPLLLSVLGVLHECRVYRFQMTKKWKEWGLVIGLHVVVATGLALLATGGTSHKPSTEKTGSVILVISWVLIAVFTVFTVISKKEPAFTAKYRDSTILLWGVLLALLPSGVRVVWELVGIIMTPKHPEMNPFAGAVGYTAALELAPLVIGSVILTTVGFLTIGEKRQKANRNTRV